MPASRRKWAPIILRLVRFAERMGIRVLLADDLDTNIFESSRFWLSHAGDDRSFCPAPKVGDVRARGLIVVSQDDKKTIIWAEKEAKFAPNLAHEITHSLFPGLPRHHDEGDAFVYVEYLIDRKNRVPRTKWMHGFGIDYDSKYNFYNMWGEMPSQVKSEVLRGGRRQAIKKKILTSRGALRKRQVLHDR